MINIIRFLLTASLVSIIAVGSGSHYEGISIDDRNYETTLKRTTFSLVNFYREGCYYCDQLEPTYKFLAELYAGKDLQILAVNYKENQRIQNIEKIEGYPTLKLYDNRVRRYVTDYEGNRDLHDFIVFLFDATGIEPKFPDIDYTRVDSLKHLNGIEGDLKRANKSALIAFVTPWLDEWSLHFSTYSKLVKELKQDTALLLVDGSLESLAEVTRYYKVDKFPTFVYKHDLAHSGFKFMDTQEGLNSEVLNAFINNGLGEWFNEIDELNEKRLEGGERMEQNQQEPGRKYQINYGGSLKDVEEEEDDHLYYRLRDL